ncbi:pilus assembly protein [Collimonas antrihumi]|uniref:pilus assembly protein n=1 Tax=Collimonas antrihumi TaxID=1940615 RepID=UPI001B8BBAAE|nr:PilC/PilY family type IV pilus protein [Collimonas antrihumi]
MLQTIFSGRTISGRMHKFLAHSLCLGMALVSGMSSAAVSPTVGDAPLFVVTPPNPNIMYTLDNSGSMVWGSVTGTDATAEFNSRKTQRAYYASAYNGIYYNPATTYTPGVDYKGVAMGTSVTSAPIDPYPTINGTSATIDVSALCYIRPSASITLPLYGPTDFSPYFTPSGGSSANCNPSDRTYTKAIAQYAFYYTWKGSGTPNGSNTETDTNYPRTDIIPTTTTYPKASTRTDCGTGSTCTYAQEIQNFANWFSYARTRILMTKTALGLAFSTIDPVLSSTYTPKFRVGFNTINAIDPSGGITYNNSDVTDGADWLTIRDFDATQKQAFYAALYAISPGQGTPLRTQMNRIGQLYQGTLSGFDYTNNDPYRNTATDASLVSCRASYHILSTDGFWNDSSSDTNFPVSSIGTTLADVTNYYYTTDLRPTLTDNVKPTNTRDTATWQHMTTFTIGLGANGTLTYTPNSTPTTWPTPSADRPTTIDDLWHAAVNGRGSYFSARDPVQLQNGLSSVLKDIAKQPGAASAVSVSGGRVSGGNSVIYVPGFESGAWIGHLKAFNLNTNGTTGTQAWSGSDAADLLPAAASRNIVTWNPSSTPPAAVAFSWANLTATQKTALSASTVLDYLRGDGSNEQTAGGGGPGTYRYRANKLGDIVNSAPLFVQASDFGYFYSSFTGGGATYNTFLSGKSSRTPMVYVGANDGMLHGFNATTGVEKFAYVPNSIYNKLQTLSSPSYAHLYYVDGPLTEGDAYDATAAAWKTYVVGSTGAGANSIFALDVTNPGSLDATSVKWEKSSGDTGFADMGKVLGQATIVKLTTGAWGVVFGNGYDSSTGVAALFVVNLSDGSVIKEFSLGGTANGLSAPALIFNANRELIGAYAGDLAGNLWRFDLSDATSAANWTKSKLFTAMDAATTPQPQPIVQKPVVGPHPSGGYLVTIGTGKFLATTDKSTTQVQSLYGIWDSSTATTTAATVSGRTALQVQTLTNQFDASSALIGRTLTNTAVDWTSKSGWYVDFPASGERVVGDLQILDNVVLLATTLAPTGDICVAGGVSQVLAANFLTGGASPNTKIYKNGILALTTDGALLSSVTIRATATNTTSAPLGKGDWAQKSNPLDGGVADELKVHTGVGPVRTWHQLTIKPN